MTNLRMRLNIHGDELLGTTKVIANIYPFDRSAPSGLRAKLRDIELTAGDDFDRWTEIEMPSGGYQIQVSLPSGRMINQDFEIPDGSAETIDIALESESPHEWLAVQNFVGNIRASSARQHDPDKTQHRWLGAVTEKLRGRRRRSPRSKISAQFDVGWLRSPTEIDPKKVWSDIEDATGNNLGGREATSVLSNALGLPGSLVLMPKIHDDGVVGTYRCVIDGPIKEAGREVTDRSAWDGAVPPRCYVFATRENSCQLVCAPLPWFDLSNGNQQSVFEVMTVDDNNFVTTAVRDTELGSILGYLTRNLLTSARKLVDNAEGMLFRKVSNPLGAAAGAYVMLSTENQRDDEHWHEWIKNLYVSFPWIPDGAIAYAMLKLNHQKTDEDVERALQAALRAFHRGLPFYAIGVRWLLDLLTAFSHDVVFSTRHDEIKNCLRAVQLVARRTDFQQTFTKIRIS